MPAFNFAGPAYEAANPLQDCQRLINWYVEMDPNADAKSQAALLGCPGLVKVTAAGIGEVRGMWVLPGNARAVVVIGATAYLFESGGLTAIGTLGTSSGQVSIRDNGALSVVAMADGVAIYTYSLTSGNFNTFNTAASRVAYIDGWFVFNSPNSQKFFTSPVYWDGAKALDASYYALKDASSDNLVSIIEHKRELWLIGERNTEVWYDAGGQFFPFARLQGATLEIGCAAPATVCKTGKGLMWLARSNRGENAVVTVEGYDYGLASTPAVSYAISQYGTTSDAFAYVYTEEGHEFYVLTFPTADVTWVFDLNMGQWHQRASFDTNTGKLHRHRSNCCMNLGDVRYVGDYVNGTIWQMTRKAYTDGPDPLVAIRRTAHVWDKGERNRVRNSWLQIEFTPGVGLPTGQGSDPQVMLQLSDDGGFTWGNEHWAGIGQQGQTHRRAIWRRLGAARDRVYEVRVTDPVPRDVVGATLRGEGTRA